jgi:hypothetical protein
MGVDEIMELVLGADQNPHPALSHEKLWERK